MNLIETRSVGNVILNKETPNRNPRVEHFIIPYYQRGYRWESYHVEALLDDIHNFIQANEENYCLQPIVVSPTTDDEGKNCWEVIDGQQRLTTLFIIFQFLNKPRYSISFERRVKSTSFLANLSEKNFDQGQPDFYFMSNAFKVIAEWFSKKTEDDISYIDQFYTSVTRKIQVIWYQITRINEDEKIDIFNRLNVGKIPLTDAELIKAHLLSKIKLGLTDREASMRQAEISNEWNLMEHELQKEEFWFFLNNKFKENISSRIEFIFNILANEKSKKYSTYLWFEKKIKNANEKIESENAFTFWMETKAVFAKLKSWYNKKTLYHFTGFLLASNYPINILLQNSDKAKSEFEEWLRSEIKNSLAKISINELSYGHKDLEKIFLLLNIITLENLKHSQDNRFPFNHYKRIKQEGGGWSIEHIHAQQSESMRDENAIRVWLEETLQAIENISHIEKAIEPLNEENDLDLSIMESLPINEKYVSRIKVLLSQSKVDIEEFNNLKNELIEVFDSSSLHELDNLALLAKRDNSALNNSIFPVKRNKIILLERQGRFIPPCTRNVFLKFYSNSDNQPYYWSKADKESYFREIKKILKPFFN